MASATTLCACALSVEILPGWASGRRRMRSFSYSALSDFVGQLSARGPLGRWPEPAWWLRAPGYRVGGGAKWPSSASTVASPHYSKGSPRGRHGGSQVSVGKEGEVRVLSNIGFSPFLSTCRQKTSVSFLSRPDLPNLAYKKLKGKSPGVIFLPGYISNMNGTKALAIEEFCKSLGHAYIRFDYSGVGNSDGKLQEGTVGRWRKDVLSIIDDLAEGPQILVGSSLGGWLMFHAAIARPQKVVALIGVATAVDGLVTQFHELPVEVKKEVEMKGVWAMPSRYSEEGVYHIQYSFIKEAEHHCLLHSPIPVNCPIRLLHGMKDDIIPWHTSIQVADRVISADVDVILRKHSDHRMKEKADIQLLVYTIDDLIDKLSTVVN